VNEKARDEIFAQKAQLNTVAEFLVFSGCRRRLRAMPRTKIILKVEANSTMLDKVKSPSF